MEKKNNNNVKKMRINNNKKGHSIYATHSVQSYRGTVRKISQLLRFT